MKPAALLRKNSYPNHKKLMQALQKLDAAGVYSVSQKTIQRDVQYLSDVYGAPIAFDNRMRGYYLTDPDWKFEIPQLDEEEMRAVTLGARLAETIMPELAAKVVEQAERVIRANRPEGENRPARPDTPDKKGNGRRANT